MTPEALANLAHLRRARDLIDREYARPLDVAALARAALMSPAHFSRQFLATYGETPHAYLMSRRIERAQALLRSGDLSVTEVCMAIGCKSLGSFSSRFRQLVGVTPSAYRGRDHSALARVPACLARDATRPRHRPASTAPTLVAARLDQAARTKPITRPAAASIGSASSCAHIATATSATTERVYSSAPSTMLPIAQAHP